MSSNPSIDSIARALPNVKPDATYPEATARAFLRAAGLHDAILVTAGWVSPFGTRDRDPRLPEALRALIALARELDGPLEATDITAEEIHAERLP